MRRSLQIRGGAVVGVLAGALTLGLGRPAEAQNNTYLDVPFNQGSLFYQYRPYRPSGSVAPSTTAPRVRPRLFRRAQPAAPQYWTPYTTTVPARTYVQPPATWYQTPAPVYAPQGYSVVPAQPAPVAVPGGR
jgi:hypothetical protein